MIVLKVWKSIRHCAQSLRSILKISLKKIKALYWDLAEAIKDIQLLEDEETEQLQVIDKPTTKWQIPLTIDK